MRKLLCAKLFIASSMLIMQSALAATITQNGTDVTFTYDDSTNYGTGFVIGNGIFFLPTDIKNQSVDGNNPGVVTDILDITITVNAGSSFLLDSITTTENGDYILDGAGSSVSASLFTQVTSLTWGWPPATSTEVVQTGVITSPQDGTTNLWSLTNINEWGWENETSVIFRIQNNLVAETNAQGELAFIQKKQVPIGIDVTVIPVPAAGWLMLSALVGLIATRRMKV